VIRYAPDHKILVMGRGFVAARDLRVGDRIRGVQGTSRITEVRKNDNAVEAELDRNTDDSPFEDDP